MTIDFMIVNFADYLIIPITSIDLNKIEIFVFIPSSDFRKVYHFELKLSTQPVYCITDYLKRLL